MDVSIVRLLQIFGPRIPRILSLVLLNKLSLSANSDKQDARVEVTVYIIRTLLGTDRPLRYVQQLSLKDPGIKGKMWISKVSIPVPDTCVRDAVVHAIKFAGDGSENYILPDVVDVEGEWTGYRNVAQKNSPRPEGDEKRQYENLMKEVTSPVTVLYFHGGAYIMMDPISHRNTNSDLARRTGGKCFSVRYRLAPQNPFPAALLDALTAYLYLLSPPPGSYHDAIPAKNIVFAGDSAGGNLASVLALLLLTLQRAGVQHIDFHGKSVAVEMPAGLALNSPWCDIARSLPSITNNAKYDYLDPPSPTGLPEQMHHKDDIWPVEPPRAEMFCQASLLVHPLVSPVVAGPEQWVGMPPVFICGGTEGLLDEYTVMARNIYKAGSPVDFVGYEGMPHCFAMIFAGTAATEDCFQRWTKFCTNAVQGQALRKANASWMKAFSSPLEFYDVAINDMGVPDEEVQQSLREIKERAIDREAAEVRQWEANKATRV